MLKDNIIGAFCRAYNVYDVIDKFLYDVYKKVILKIDTHI